MTIMISDDDRRTAFRQAFPVSDIHPENQENDWLNDEGKKEEAQ